MKNPKINDCCNVIYDGQDKIAIVTDVDNDALSFSVKTFSGDPMYNIPHSKFRYNHSETITNSLSLKECIEKLEKTNYENEAGYLNNRLEFIKIKRSVQE